MAQGGRLISARNCGFAVMALLTVLAILVAPICAPLCAAMNCAEGGRSGGAETHCHQMALHQNGFCLDAKHLVICGNTELRATLNATRAKDSPQDAGQANTAASDFLGPQESLAVIENGRSQQGSSADTGSTHNSSSVTVLRI